MAAQFCQILRQGAKADPVVALLGSPFSVLTLFVPQDRGVRSKATRLGLHLSAGALQTPEIVLRAAMNAPRSSPSRASSWPPASASRTWRRCSPTRRCAPSACAAVMVTWARVHGGRWHRTCPSGAVCPPRRLVRANLALGLTLPVTAWRTGVTFVDSYVPGGATFNVIIGKRTAAYLRCGFFKRACPVAPPRPSGKAGRVHVRACPRRARYLRNTAKVVRRDWRVASSRLQVTEVPLYPF